MPHPASAPAPAGRSPRVFTAADLDQLTARAGLAPPRRQKIQAAAAATGFRVTSHITEELIDWTAAPDDPIYRLYFPSEDIPAGTAPGGPARERPGSQTTGPPGIRQPSHDCVLIVPAREPGSRRYALPCPGRTRPDGSPGPQLAAEGIPQLTAYLTAHPEVTSVHLTGGDPLIMSAAALRRYIEPLLSLDQVASVTIRTSALACWPDRFLTDPDAGNTLHLLSQVPAAGKNLTLTAAFCHPRELEPAPVREAVRQIRSTGTVICTEGHMTGSVNDTPGSWAQMWRTQVRMGLIPGTMLLHRVTGPAVQYQVPLARAQNIFAGAYAAVSGLARTVRGPLIHDQHGTVCIDGTAQAGTQHVFMLRYIQARDPSLTGTPFFAAFDPAATWITDLTPAHQFPAIPPTPAQ